MTNLLGYLSTAKWMTHPCKIGNVYYIIPLFVWYSVTAVPYFTQLHVWLNGFWQRHNLTTMATVTNTLYLCINSRLISTPCDEGYLVVNWAYCTQIIWWTWQTCQCHLKHDFQLTPAVSGSPARHKIFTCLNQADHRSFN